MKIPFSGGKLKLYKFEIAVVLTGIVLMLIGGMVENAQEKYEEENHAENLTVEKTEKEAYSRGYSEYYAEQIEELLKNMEGIRSVSVAVYVKSEGTAVPAENVSSDNSVTKEKDSEGGTREENKNTVDREIVIIKDSQGNESTVFLTETAPEIEGIAVCVKGGVGAATEEKIVKTLMALYGISAAKISITG